MQGEDSGFQVRSVPKYHYSCDGQSLQSAGFAADWRIEGTQVSQHLIWMVDGGYLL